MNTLVSTSTLRSAFADDLQVEYAEARALAEPERRFDDEGTALLRTVRRCCAFHLVSCG